VRAFAVGAHAHYLGKEFTLKATLPDGTVKTLLSIGDWDFSWQERYRFKDFVSLPKGTKLDSTVSYDNSVANKRNPSRPPVRVQWGEESTDEMGSIGLQVVAANRGDSSAAAAGDCDAHPRARVQRAGIEAVVATARGARTRTAVTPGLKNRPGLHCPLALSDSVGRA
jgi:hypothetical protein